MSERGPCPDLERTWGFWLGGEPQPQPRPRARILHLRDGREVVQVYQPQPAERWRERLGIAIRAADPPQQPWLGPVTVTIELVFGVPGSWPAWKQAYLRDRPCCSGGDVDNLAKPILDALTGVVYADDRQVWSCMVDNRWAGERGPRATVAIRGRVQAEPRTRKELKERRQAVDLWAEGGPVAITREEESPL